MKRQIFAIAAALVTAACQSTTDPSTGPGRLAPPGAPPGTCWDNIAVPAVVETVTEQVLVSPAAYNTDGTLYRAAQYRTEVRQNIVRERQENWFQTLCPKEMTDEFVATLQRALKARQAYRGAVTGRYDPSTRAAVRRWQKERGLDSTSLARSTATELGILAVGRTE